MQKVYYLQNYFAYFYKIVYTVLRILLLLCHGEEIKKVNAVALKPKNSKVDRIHSICYGIIVFIQNLLLRRNKYSAVQGVVLVSTGLLKVEKLSVAGHHVKSSN